MCDRPGIIPAPYSGTKFKWVQVSDFEALTETEWVELIRQAYEKVKAKLPKKVREAL
ncbi:MAG: hypothetical protein K9J37_07750 [Saprospiraceae bacterium]|nr:hypothetical protein [Saprospiraceae bacterium]MCF8249791.1 hypothetical protein [Saprospiraceae bacterium]MCF8279276.1 hypothetical protein [Bacteroidales bacterium]MCF8313458.1 hypothetical protein [Saprospiraceae bacterium]MCF8442171.1 hypothetical protein [Saprospiraceae bacterium]